MTNIFEQQAGVRKLLAEYKAELPELLEKSTWYYDKPEHREAWLISFSRHQILKELVERLEEILQ